MPVQADDAKTHTSGYDEQLDKLRKGTRWQGVRLQVLKRDPFCKRCQQAVAEICDHVVPAAMAIMQAQASRLYPFDKWAGYYLKTNLQGLCRPCHGQKTIEDKTHTGPWPDVVAAAQAQPKKQWGF